MSFSDNLKKYREKAGYSQRAAAEALNMSQSGYCKYENDKSSPAPETLLDIAQLFGVPVGELLTGVSPEYDNITGGGLTAQERELVNIYRRLGLEEQMQLIRTLLELDKRN